jgi:flavin reductase (DIM6/NTAB) family NADH-FMN oxidoreductase RutF
MGEGKKYDYRFQPRGRHGVNPVAQPLDPAELRRVFGAFPSGVIAIAAMVDGVPVGMAASSFTSVSLDPPLVMICVAATSTTWPKFRDAPSFGVSVFAADQAQACRQLAAKSDDRFADIEWRATEDGAIILEGATAWLHCRKHAVFPGGDHDIVVLRVHDLDADHAIHPLVFHASKFHRLEA